MGVHKRIDQCSDYIEEGTGGAGGRWKQEKGYRKDGSTDPF
jgi:hypothetical protein